MAGLVPRLAVAGGVVSSVQEGCQREHIAWRRGGATTWAEGVAHGSAGVALLGLLGRGFDACSTRSGKGRADERH